MKKKIIVFLACLFFSGSLLAGKPVLVGTLNLISTRNIDSNKNYTLLKTGVNDTKKAFKNIKAKDLTQAVNAAVSLVPGGEFLQNVKVYTDGKKWAIVADVWGLAENANIEGFRIGEPAYLKNSLLKTASGGHKFIMVTIAGFKDKKSCLVEFENGDIKAVKYSELSKSGE